MFRIFNVIKLPARLVNEKLEWFNYNDLTYVNLNECSATPSSQLSFSVLCFVSSSIYLERETF